VCQPAKAHRLCAPHRCCIKRHRGLRGRVRPRSLSEFDTPKHGGASPKERTTMPRLVHTAIGVLAAAVGLSTSAVPQAMAAPFQLSAARSHGEAGLRAHPHAVQWMTQRESRRRIRRAPVERYSPALSSPGYTASPWGSSCPAPHKEAHGACVRECPGGFEDRGSFCNLIKSN
jgi:hypothetical protein